MGVLRCYVVTAMICCLTILGGQNHVASKTVTTDSDPSELPLTQTETMPDSTTTETTEETAFSPEQHIYTADPASEKIPDPKQGIWSFTDDIGITCIVITFAAQVNVTPLFRDAYIPSETFVTNVPRSAAVVGGSCDSQYQWINISWPVKYDAVNVKYNYLVLTYQAKGANMYSLKYQNLTLQPEMFPASLEIVDPVTFSHGAVWDLPIGTSFRCSSPKPITMWPNMFMFAELNMYHLQEEAFRNEAGETFSSAYNCNRYEGAIAIIGICLLLLTTIAIVNKFIYPYMVRQRRANMTYNSITKEPKMPLQ